MFRIGLTVCGTIFLLAVPWARGSLCSSNACTISPPNSIHTSTAQGTHGIPDYINGGLPYFHSSNTVNGATAFVSTGTITDVQGDCYSGIAPQIRSMNRNAVCMARPRRQNDSESSCKSNGEYKWSGEKTSLAAEEGTINTNLPPPDPAAVENSRLEFYVSQKGSDEKGDGSAMMPWKTIMFAMTTMHEASADSPVTLNVGEGIYDEQIICRPYVEIKGAGCGITKIRYFNAADDDHYVVLAAAGTSIRACTITLPAPISEQGDLIRILDSDMNIIRCEINGLYSPTVTGVFVSGKDSSPSIIRDTTLHNLQYGVVSTDSGLNITRNQFEEISEYALWVRTPDGNEGTVTEVPVLGKGNRKEETGFNQFCTDIGLFIKNASSSTVNAEYNDWGIDTEEEIGERISNCPGNVDYIPFLGEPLVAADVSGIIAVELVEATTGNVIPLDASPLVKLNYLTGIFDPASCLYLFSNLDPGTHICTASAKGYIDQTQSVLLPAGQIVTLKIMLSENLDGDPDDCSSCNASSKTFHMLLGDWMLVGVMVIVLLGSSLQKA